MSRSLTGIGVSPGSAIGPAAVVRPPEPLPEEQGRSADPASDQARIESALSEVAAGLEARAAELTGDAAEMVTAAAMIARDPGLAEAVSQQLAAGHDAVHALHEAVEGYARQLEDLGGYFAERVSDLRDVGMRAECLLLGRPIPGIPELLVPSIIVAVDLAPADTAPLDPAMVLGIVTAAGGRTSHTAILAAQRGLPAAVQVHGAMDLVDGELLALDGDSGRVVVSPGPEVISRLTARAQRLAEIATLSGPGRTLDGHRVALLANIGDAADARAAAATEVEGVGLFRTEFLFLDARSEPGVEEQTRQYTDVLAPFTGRTVTVRTLDAGADKPLAFADLGPEPNPAMGRRAYRLCAALPHLLQHQLEALARAQANTGTSIKVMAPMIATAQEAAEFASAAHAWGLEVAGVMIEIPSSALRAGHLLAECDFASLGTNDLAQYTMAADRMVGELSELLDPFQPAVLDLVSMACEGGALNGKPVGVCGESAADPLMALVLTGLGVSSLSMSASRVPLVRFALLHHCLATCQQMARAAREAVTAEQARQAVADMAAPELQELLMAP